ncbi:MAG: NfeD family protein [Clostridiales bacterium]|nr:NfeD family protein [Clostridiales bacterium]
MESMLYVWIVLLVVLIIVEAATAQMVTIWFAVGALAALLANIFGAELWLQFALFAVVSAISLALTRPIVKKMTKRSVKPTNADRAIGQDAVVLETINNLESTGQASVNGAVWTARSSDNSVIEKGETVTVDRIEGVKIIVSRKNAPVNNN